MGNASEHHVVTGVESAVEIWSDEWGIPHIHAENTHDAAFAQGFAHATDRLWQLESMRMQLLGRWAEWVGASGVASDTFMRTLGPERASRRDYDALTPQARAIADAYAAGVNAAVANIESLPLEFGLVGATPEPWEGWVAVANLRMRSFLMGSFWFKLWRAAALEHVTPEQMQLLRYDGGSPELLCIPPGSELERSLAPLAELAPAIRALAELRSPSATEGASNNWAVGGSRTASGKPLMAGDPHRAFEIPALYVQQHVACPEFDAIGFTIPGSPGFSNFGHNGRVAWGVTHAFADIHDLYLEQFDSDGRVRTAAGWQAPERRLERIAVAGAADVEIKVTRSPNGPIIAGGPEQSWGIALKSAQLELLDRSFETLYPMLAASNVSELFASQAPWGIIDHNLVAADVDGHIGHLVRARLPRRSDLNGWLPVPGWDDAYAWNGIVEASDMPVTIDPERGYLATANNRVTDRVPATGDYFATDTHPPHRARRIEQLLSRLDAATPVDMEAIHGDAFSLTADGFQRLLAAVTVTDDAAERTRAMIVDWDGVLSEGSTAATAYTLFRRRLAQVVLERSGLGAVSEGFAAGLVAGANGPVNQLWWTLPDLVRRDDRSLLGGWSWEQAAREALSRVSADELGPWADVHTVRFAHNLAAHLPAELAQQTEALAPTGAHVGGDNETVWANGVVSGAGTRAVYGAVARYVFDLSDLASSRWVSLTGASGDPEGAHYLDQHEHWGRRETVPMRYDWADVRSHSVLASLLEPAATAG